MESFEKLVEASKHHAIQRAARMSPGEKLLMGPALFDRQREVLIAALKKAHPDADEQEIRRLVREHLDLSRECEDISFSHTSLFKKLEIDLLMNDRYTHSD